MRAELIMILAAALLDWIIGDSRIHPVVLIGSLISALTKRLNRGGFRRLKGFLLVIIVIAVTAGVAVLIEVLLYNLSYILYVVVNVLLLSSALAEKSLKEAGERVEENLGDIKKARTFTGYIVGRDTTALSRSDLIRATVETVAENGIDGVIAPYFYMLLGVIPALYTPYVTPLVFAYVYKSINTMDSMVGYTDPPYTRFGTCAARLDDIVNYVPARIGSWFYFLSGRILGYKGALKIYKKYKNAHASPNSGHPESMVAGLLGVELGGDNVYFGNLHKKEKIGEKRRELQDKDISRTIQIVRLSEALIMLLTLIAII